MFSRPLLDATVLLLVAFSLDETAADETLSLEVPFVSALLLEFVATLSLELVVLVEFVVALLASPLELELVAFCSRTEAERPKGLRLGIETRSPRSSVRERGVLSTRPDSATGFVASPFSRARAGRGPTSGARQNSADRALDSVRLGTRSNQIDLNFILRGVGAFVPRALDQR